MDVLLRHSWSDQRTPTTAAAPAPPARPQESQGFPRVERDVLQVEQFSAKLRAKAARADATSEALDASRLLAQEGLNPRRRARHARRGRCPGPGLPARSAPGCSAGAPPAGPENARRRCCRRCCRWCCRLNQALQGLQLRPTYEDVFQVETSTVEEYLQQAGGRGGGGPEPAAAAPPAGARLQQPATSSVQWSKPLGACMKGSRGRCSSEGEAVGREEGRRQARMQREGDGRVWCAASPGGVAAPPPPPPPPTRPCLPGCGCAGAPVDHSDGGAAGAAQHGSGV